MARRRSFGNAGSRPMYEWFTFGDALVNQLIPAKIFGTTGSVALIAQTLVRTRGMIGVTLDTSAVDEQVMVRAGLIVITADAAVAGIVPGPGSDRGEDWFWTGQIFLTSGAEAAIIPDRLSGQIVVDSKAMRKLKPGNTIVLAVETLASEITDQGGTLDFYYAIDGLSRTS